MVEDIRFGLRSENLFLLLFLFGLRSKFARRKWNSLFRLVGSYFFSLFDLIWFPLKQSDKDTNWPDLFCLFVRSSSCVPPVWWFQLFFFFVCVCWKSSASVSCQNSTEMHFFLYYDWPETGPRKFLGLLYYQARVLFFLSYLSKLHNQPTNIHERYLLREVTKNTNKLFEIKIPKFG
jgi:hypothetical protein